MLIDPRLLDILRCPATRQRLHVDGEKLITEDGRRRYRVVAGIPIMLRADAEPTHKGYTDAVKLNAAADTPCQADIDHYLDRFAGATCGNLFVGLKLRDRFPIPDFPEFLRPGLSLDIGCNWGRWTFAGALAGHSMVGIDITLSGCLVAQALAHRLARANPPLWVVGDGRYLPFADHAFDNAFSYSVVQHFSRENAARITREIGRTLKPGGRSAVQMPNCNGLKALITMPRRRFADGKAFDVRYYAVGDLTRMFEAGIGPSNWSIDCFLGLNVHGKDRDLVPRSKRWIIDVAEALKATAGIVPPLRRLSDSVWVNSVARQS